VEFFQRSPTFWVRERADSARGWRWLSCKPKHHFFVMANATEAPVNEGIRWLDAATIPAPRDEVIIKLGKLALLTKFKDRGTDDLKGMIAAFAERLSEYPGDAVMTALHEYPLTNRFWPSLEELAAEVLKRSWRHHLKSRLINFRDNIMDRETK
jgi:hypothetical protein